MRDRSPRFSLRALMIAVVLLAIGMWIARLVNLSLEYRRRSERYAYWGRWPAPAPGPALDRHIRQVEWAHALGRKYERAARQPWAQVDPDPPMPE